MSEQLPLTLVEPDMLAAEFRSRIRAAIEAIGLKDVCWDTGIDRAQLCNQLAGRQTGRGYNHLRADILPYVVRRAPNNDILELLADLRGLELVPVRPMEPAEELAALKDALGSLLGPELRAAVEAKARRLRR